MSAVDLQRSSVVAKTTSSNQLEPGSPIEKWLDVENFRNEVSLSKGWKIFNPAKHSSSRRSFRVLVPDYDGPLFLVNLSVSVTPISTFSEKE